MQIRSEDVLIQAFTPSDGSPSAAIKVVHRQSGKEVVNTDTDSQRTNLRHALLDLVLAMNPTPDQIRPSELTLFDHVSVRLSNTVHQGEITDLTWDFTQAEWTYFVECGAKKVTDRYVAADLELQED